MGKHFILNDDGYLEEAKEERKEEILEMAEVEKLIQEETSEERKE